MPTNNLSVPGIVGIAILVILVLVIIVRNIYVVQQSRAYVVERLGAFHSVWGVGLHLKVPFIERVVKKVSLKEQVADFDPQPVITKDNVTMQIDTVIYFQITDPKLYTYGVEYPMNAIENLTATTLRNICCSRISGWQIWFPIFSCSQCMEHGLLCTISGSPEQTHDILMPMG